MPFPTTPSCFLKINKLSFSVQQPFAQSFWYLSQTLISIINRCLNQGYSPYHTCMFPKQKGNSREALSFALGTRPSESWGQVTQIGVLTSFSHGRNLTFLKRSKYFQSTIPSFLLPTHPNCLVWAGEG